jgi:8-oxo-dGTP diphosphatase
MQDDFKKLVLGFVFNKNLKKVVLIHKNRPEWQKGKLNAIGGKLKIDETKKSAMVREFFEETGAKTLAKDWIEFGKMIETGKEIYLFTTIFNGNISLVKTNTDEEIQWCDAHTLPRNIMTNLSWLIPLAIDKLQNKEIEHVTVQNNF